MGKTLLTNCCRAALVAGLFGLAQAASGESLEAAVINCSAQPDAAAQLACYNQIAAGLKAVPAQAVNAPAVPLPQVAAPPVAAEAPPPPPAAHASADFGGDSLPFKAGASDAPDSLQAVVAHVSFNYFHRFTVVLDNGQVWRQSDSDTNIAPFDTSKHQTVTIKSGFMGSFHLNIQGEWGSFAVKRIK